MLTRSQLFKSGAVGRCVLVRCCAKLQELRLRELLIRHNWALLSDNLPPRLALLIAFDSRLFLLHPLLLHLQLFLLGSRVLARGLRVRQACTLARFLKVAIRSLRDLRCLELVISRLATVHSETTN